MSSESPVEHPEPKGEGSSHGTEQPSCSNEVTNSDEGFESPADEYSDESVPVDSILVDICNDSKHLEYNVPKEFNAYFDSRDIFYPVEDLGSISADGRIYYDVQNSRVVVTDLFFGTERSYECDFYIRCYSPLSTSHGIMLLEVDVGMFIAIARLEEEPNLSTSESADAVRYVVKYDEKYPIPDDEIGAYSLHRLNDPKLVGVSYDSAYDVRLYIYDVTDIRSPVEKYELYVAGVNFLHIFGDYIYFFEQGLNDALGNYELDLNPLNSLNRKTGKRNSVAIKGFDDLIPHFDCSSGISGFWTKDTFIFYRNVCPTSLPVDVYYHKFAHFDLRTLRWEPLKMEEIPLSRRPIRSYPYDGGVVIFVYPFASDLVSLHRIFTRQPENLRNLALFTLRRTGNEFAKVIPHPPVQPLF